MAVRSSSEGILSDDRAQKREELIELLKQAYFMELETVMSYVANSINPDGVRAQEIRQSLAGDVQEELSHASSRSASRSYTGPFPARTSSRRSSPTCSRPSTRPTSCTSSRA